MAIRFIAYSLFILQAVNSQYYGIPASSTLNPSYNYYYNTNYYYPSPQLPVFAPTFAPTPTPPIFVPTSTTPSYPSTTPIPPKSPPKRSVVTPNPKCSPPTASAYFLSTPTETVKASVISPESPIPPKYTCPLCNGFADVPPNSKIPPPPPIGCPVLPGILDKIPTILEDLKSKDPCSCLLSKTLKSDMYEKHKLPKNLSYDQELLEGFLTGLGL